nr:NAD(P)-dependent alcohol dehydrogenase [Nocardioides marinisabuli]
MRALQLLAPHVLELRDVPLPEIGPDEVLVKVSGAGLCHTDVSVLHGPQRPTPALTLGHETAGTIAAMGSAVTGWSEGDPVLVCLVWACGTCRACLDGRDNVCSTSATAIGTPPCPGLGPAGGMAEYMKAPARHLEPLGTLDPVTAGPLADAGLTPMHAINGARHRLGAHSTALVLGAGGLGHIAVQILKATTDARIVAVDVSRDKLETATLAGADEVLLNGAEVVSGIRELTDGHGVDAAFDFVGSQATLDVAAQSMACDGALRLVGAGGGTVTYPSIPRPRSLAWGVDVRRSYTGTRDDQRQVLHLAQIGSIAVETVLYTLDEGPAAFADLLNGDVTGRAVLVP